MGPAFSARRLIFLMRAMRCFIYCVFQYLPAAIADPIFKMMMPFAVNQHHFFKHGNFGNNSACHFYPFGRTLSITPAGRFAADAN